MRTKTITIDCGGCDLCTAGEEGNFICSWGKGTPKVMLPPKGKKVIRCKLKVDE